MCTVAGGKKNFRLPLGLQTLHWSQQHDSGEKNILGLQVFACRGSLK
jgi:hypothetical protein